MDEEARKTETARRIKERWSHANSEPKPLVLHNAVTIERIAPNNKPGISTYPGSDILHHTADFLGDWRSVNSWQRFDMLRVRSRSRQIERGNPWGQSWQKSLTTNVVGAAGFKLDPNILTSKILYGDTTDGARDEGACVLAKEAFEGHCEQENCTTRKMLDGQDLDKLIITRLCFDGEVIMRKVRGFRSNEYKFAWQMIDPDYLDHNLNRIEPNGNFTQMGIELDKDWKFPVAYWFFKRRPNDYFYNYLKVEDSLYERVPAEEIYHFFIQTEDPEQVRGWPWLFAAAVNLFRMGRYEEAALVNATIGASKVGFYKKTVPDGFTGDPDSLEDDGVIIDKVPPGSFVELPYNVEPVPWDSKYPEDQFDSFSKAMLRSISACLGSSYMSLTGDVSDANFSNMRAAEGQEHEHWMMLQDFMIRKWKKPQYKEVIYRAILSGKLKLPLSKLEKFSKPKFRGKRWPYVNPVDDQRANELALNNRIKSVTQVIEETGGDAQETFRQIAADEKQFKELGIERVKPNAGKPEDDDKDDKGKKPKKDKPKSEEK